MAKRDTVDRNK